MLVLLNEGIFGVGEYLYKCRFVKLVKDGDNRKSAHQLGNHTEFHKVLRGNVLEDVLFLFISALYVSTEAESCGILALFDSLLQTVKSTAADEKDILCVDLNALLIGVLSAAVGGNI